MSTANKKPRTCINLATIISTFIKSHCSGVMFKIYFKALKGHLSMTKLTRFVKQP
jgi:hypothetical protein